MSLWTSTSLANGAVVSHRNLSKLDDLRESVIDDVSAKMDHTDRAMRRALEVGAVPDYEL